MRRMYRYFLLVLLACALALHAAYLVQSFYSQRDLARRERGHILHQQVYHAERYLQEIEACANTLCISPRLQQVLIDRQTMDYLAFADCRDLLTEYEMTPYSIYRIDLYVENSHSLITSSEGVFYHLDEGKRAVFEKMLHKTASEPSYWTLNYQTSEPSIVARTRNTRYITLVKRVVSIYTGKTKGILMLSVPYDQFASFTAQTPEGEYSCLSFREKLLCGERVSHPGWTTISMALEHEDFVFEYAYLFRFFTIFSRGFLLVMTVIMLLFLLGFVLIVFIAERSVAKPVDRLLDGFVRVEKGEFDARMDNDGDEIFGDLNRGFDHMAGHLQSTVNELVDERIRGRELKQRLLLMQIKPHFLYNIFNNMIWLVEQKKYDNLEQLVTATAGFYKSALNAGADDILLYDNQRQLDYYVRIQKFRFGDRFDLHMEVSEEAQELCIPNLLLQPLVENAISHGFANLDRRGLITLTAWVENQELLIRVCDNGCGIPPGLLDEIRRAMISGADSSQRFFALVNVASRLRSRYGGRASIDITSRSGEGTEVAICIPAALCELQEGYRVPNDHCG